MKKGDMAEYVLRNIRYTQIRSWLTMLGIFIGIMAIIVLIGLADGLKNEVKSELDKFGSDTIIIIPVALDGSQSGLSFSSGMTSTSGKLFERDYERIKKIAGINVISKSLYGKANVRYKEQDVAISVYGIEPEAFKKTTQIEIERGRFLEENEFGSAVIGNAIVEDAFEKKVELNSKFAIGNKTYKVVGILKKTGNSFFNPDNVIFVNYENGREIFEENLAPKEINAIRLTVQDSNYIEEISDEITQELLSLHKVRGDNKDFGVITSKFINEQVDGILGTITLFLVIVAGISLVVGAIGISNTMFMNVMERTREIGVLRSIGLTKKDILGIFVMEASFLGILGGIGGILFGWIVLALVNIALNVQATFSLPVAIAALVISGMVGMISGAIPANNASGISPVEALRYE